MATLTKGKTFVNGELVTPQKLHELVDLASITGIVTAEITDSAITTAKLAANSVTTAKIADANVTTAKLADSAVTSAKIADGTIVNADISAAAAIADTKLATISTAEKVANSATTATSTNTANAIVTRDSLGNFSAGTITAALAGNAATATKLATARTISLTGDVTGSANFDGSANASITATVADDSHNHIISNIDGLQTALDGKQAAGSYAAAAHTHTTATAPVGATPGVSGFMSAADKTKLDGVATGANNYVHPTGDGNLHVPATSTTNNGKVLKAGSTAGSLSWGTLTAADVGAAASTHTHGNITNAGAIGTTANVPIITGTSGVLQAGSFGTTAGTYCQGNDSRLSDARTPTAHTHDDRYYTETEVNTLLAGKLGTTATAAAATKLATARTINGVAFDGSSNITIPGPSSPASLTADADTLVLRDNVGSIEFTNGVCRQISGIPSSLGSGEFYLSQTPSGPILELGMPAVISGSRFQTFYRAGVEIGKITTTGTTGVAYNTTSDYRLKTNLEPLTDAVARLLQIPVHRFNWVADPNAPKVDGFLAHEAQAIVPESVTGHKDEVDAEGKPIHQGIDQSKLVPLLVAAVQELAARVAALEAR